MTLETLKNNFHQHVKQLQDAITRELCGVDPGIKFIEDIWTRQDFKGNEGGGGITRAFAGNVIENAGVNTSLIYGAVDPNFAKTLRQGKESEETPYSNHVWAAGISLIIHPRNPKVPTIHANFRLLHLGTNHDFFWFGGGADLTPYYPHEEDFIHFHQIWKNAVIPYGEDLYKKMKEDCDHYFVNHHRGGEMRGVGGLFFDHFRSGDEERDFSMILDLSNQIIPSYFPLVNLRKDEPFNALDEDFQLHRRGRYVEFNLLHDRGTSFGLKTNGRTDSILISLPGRCKFTYQYQPLADSPHDLMMKYYRPKKWV